MLVEEQPKPLPPAPPLLPLNHILPTPPLLPSNPEINRPEVEPMETGEKELLALVAAKLGTGPPPPPPAVSLPLKMPPLKIEERKGPHPIESVPVAGTPWSIVFTSDKKQFFFDATSRKSFWKLPPELMHNTLVFKILESPPWKKRELYFFLSSFLISFFLPFLFPPSPFSSLSSFLHLPPLFFC